MDRYVRFWGYSKHRADKIAVMDRVGRGRIHPLSLFYPLLPGGAMVIPTTTITPEQKNELDIYYPNHRLSSCSIFFFYTYPVFSPVASLSTLTAARMYPRTTSMRPHMTTVRPMARVVATNAYVNAYKGRMEGSSSFFSSPPSPGGLPAFSLPLLPLRPAHDDQPPPTLVGARTRPFRPGRTRVARDWRRGRDCVWALEAPGIG